MLDDLSRNVWEGKYALKKDDELVEKEPSEMFRRQAKEFARIEAKYPNPMTEDEIYSLLDGFDKVIPQGSVMAMLGNPYQLGSLSNCIVLPEVYDSYGGIGWSDQAMAQLMKRRCGVGVDISTLRPKGSNVNNAAGSSTGAVSFMERFSNTTREVAQDGRRRICA